MKAHIPQLTGFYISSVGAITANMEHLDFWLRCIASIVAIVAGSLTALSVIRNWNKRK